MAKICIVRHAYYPQETHVRRNAETLVRQGHSVSLVCLRDAGQPRTEVISGVAVYRLPVRHYRRGAGRYVFEYAASFLCALCAVSWLHLAKRFDVVEVDSMPDFLVFSSVIPKLMGARIVAYLFEAMPEEFVYKYRLSADHWMFRFQSRIEQAAIRYADHVLTVGEALRQLFVSRGAAAEKISVILNVPNEAVFQPAEDSCVPPPVKAGFTMITHGTLIELYGIQVIIRAMPSLRARIPNVHLVVAGDGEYAGALKRLAEEIGVSDMVNFTGWIPQLDVVRLIRNADVGIVPILGGGYGELMVPNKLFEYIALKKPVVCSSLKAIRYYFDESSLKYFPSGDAQELADCVFELCRRPELGESMAKRAFKIYDEYRWEKVSVAYGHALVGGKTS